MADADRPPAVKGQAWVAKAARSSLDTMEAIAQGRSRSEGNDLDLGFVRGGG